jgi:peptide/nickel transport system substrate-binding protein
MNGSGVSRRRALRWLIGGAGVALLAACQSAPGASTPTPTSVALSQGTPAAAAVAPARTVAQPRTGGTLRVGRADELETLDGQRFVSNTIGITYGTVYERLIDYDQKVVPQPMLAESWDFANSGKQLTFKLRKGVKWHTGREFTSDDVKYSVERIRDPKVGGGFFLSYTKRVAAVETPDKYTAVVNFEPAWPTALDLFEQLNMVDPQTMQGPNAQTTAVGTGPFTFVEWKQGQYVKFARNPNYWRSDRPYLDGVEINPTNDAQAMVVQLEGGSLDAICDAPLGQLVRLKDDPKYGAIVTPSGLGGFYVLGVNQLAPGANPVLQDKRVRQALNLSIDRKRFNQTALYGLGEPANLPWPPGSEGYEASKQANPEFNLDKAKAMFATAGAANAEFELAFRGTDQEATKFTQILQADLASIGIKLTIKPMESSVYAQYTQNRMHQLSLATSAGAQYHPSTLFLSGNGARIWGGIDADTAAAITAEPDEARRRQMSSQINDTIFDQALDMVVGHTQRSLLYAQKVHGLVRSMNQVSTYVDTWLDA